MTETVAGAQQGGRSWPSLAVVRRDVAAGVTVAATLLPSCIAAGLVTYGAMGPDFAAMGLAAALLATIIGGFFTSLLSTSSFMITFALPSIAVVQGSLVISLLAQPAFAAKPALILPALACCVLICGAAIVLIALTGVARIIKFTPHPVMAGFKNGISLTLLVMQLKPFIGWSMQQAAPVPVLAHPMQLAAVGALALLMLGLDRIAKAVPAALLGIIIGTALYHASARWLPGLDLGGTLGTVAISLPPSMPLLGLADAGTLAALTATGPLIVQYAVVLAVFITLQSLLGFRLAQNLADVPIKPSRDLAALGAGNGLSALFGGLAISAAPGQASTAFRAGGRTRVVELTMCLLLLALTLLVPHWLALVPSFAIAAVVVCTAIQTLDPWSLALLQRISAAGAGAARRDCYDLGIVATVMLVTACFSVLPGVAVGVALACLVFIINMSRPLIRRQMTGAGLTSKRVRSMTDAAHLRETGERRAVMELGGVLFFGNTEGLAEEVTARLSSAEAVLLDCRGVSDIDASGAAILRTLVERARKLQRRVLFCNVPPPFIGQFTAIAKHGQQPAPFPDLDTALEWMEEQALASRPKASDAQAELRLDQHDFVRGLEPGELATFAALLRKQSFPAGTTMCRQGDPGDRMWLLVRGSVSIRIDAADKSRGTRRLASLAQGTTVGEMSLIEDGRRSATIVANEDVACLELSKAGYQEILARHPGIAAKLFGNLLREMAARIRDNHVDLREAVG